MVERISSEKPKDSRPIVIDTGGHLPDIKELSPPIDLDNYNQERNEPQLIEWLLKMDVSQVPRRTMAIYPERMSAFSRQPIIKRLKKYGDDLSGISDEDRKYAQRFGVKFKTTTEDQVRRRCIRDFLIEQFGSIRGIEENISPKGLAKLGFRIEKLGELNPQYNLIAIKSGKK